MLCHGGVVRSAVNTKNRFVVVTALSYGLSKYALEMVVRVLVLELIPLTSAIFVALRCAIPNAAEVYDLRAQVVHLRRVRNGAAQCHEDRGGQRDQLQHEHAHDHFQRVFRQAVAQRGHDHEAVFGIDGTADDTAVTQHIKNIRSKLRAAGVAEPETLLKTIWGVGYQWKNEG